MIAAELTPAVELFVALVIAIFDAAAALTVNESADGFVSVGLVASFVSVMFQVPAFWSL